MNTYSHDLLGKPLVQRAGPGEDRKPQGVGPVQQANPEMDRGARDPILAQLTPCAARATRCQTETREPAGGAAGGITLAAVIPTHRLGRVEASGAAVQAPVRD